MMPDDFDADVMKIIISEDGDILLFLRQSVAQIAAGLGVEQFPATLGLVADGVVVSGDEMIKRRIQRNERPLVSGNGAPHVLLVQVTAERLHELILVVIITGNFSDGNAPDGSGQTQVDEADENNNISNVITVPISAPPPLFTETSDTVRFDNLDPTRNRRSLIL